MASRLTPVEFLSFSTVRIQAHLSNGLISTGKGFFYAIKQEDGGRHIPVIITNNHVVRDSTKGTFRLTLQKSDGSPDIGNHISITLDEFYHQWRPHPNSNVDLCVLPIAPLMRLAEQQGKRFFFTQLDKTLLPTDQDLDSMFGMDDITMIGYPINFPVIFIATTSFLFGFSATCLDIICPH